MENTAPPGGKGGHPPTPGEERKNPWELTHGESFHGQRIPLGVAATFRPPDTHEFEEHTMKGRSMEGMFAGYEMGPGYQWNGFYRVWPL